MQFLESAQNSTIFFKRHMEYSLNILSDYDRLDVLCSCSCRICQNCAEYYPIFVKQQGGVFVQYFEKLRHENPCSCSWAFIPASFWVTHYNCFWTCKSEHWGGHLEAGPSAQLHSSLQVMILDLDTWALDCHLCAGPASQLHSQWRTTIIVTIVSRVGCLGIGLASLELGLRTSFILYIKVYLLLNLHVLKVDLSLQHWTCHFEAGPPAQLHS